MLAPGQEIHPIYLRTLRQTFMHVLLAEMTDPAARDATMDCASVLVRMIADLEKLPASEVAARREPALRALLVTPAATQVWLDRRFSDCSPRVRDCRQIAGGRSKLTVFVALAASTQLPGALVVRIDNPGSAQNTSVCDEFPVLRAMHIAGVRAPEPLWLETDPSFLGAPFLVMRRMAGSAPGNLWSAQGVSRRIALALADVLVSIQRQDVHAIWPSAPVSAREAVEQMLATLRARWRHATGVTSLTIECAFGWLEQNKKCIGGSSVPVHGDAHFANVLAEGDELVCLTDWEFCHAGHPAEDLAFCQRAVEQIMPWGEFLAHYRAGGGMHVTDDQLSFFRIWGYLRNAVYAADALSQIPAKPAADLQTLAIALDSRARNRGAAVPSPCV